MLKKRVLAEICSVSFHPIKEKIQQVQAKYDRKLSEKQEKKAMDKDEVGSPEKASAKQPIYQHYFGKYLIDKNIARDV